MLRALSTVREKIVYTITDEAPALATYSLLPIVKNYVGKAGIALETADISLAARVLAQFPDKLSEDQRVPDTLAELGELAKKPEANIIKLPNISASVPQLNETIQELRAKGYNIPLYNPNPQTDEEKDNLERFGRVLGSAVNPVLREGNSDRRVAPPVKEYARKNPHSMGIWSKASRSHVAHMTSGDFYGNEQSYVLPAEDSLKITLTSTDGAETVLKPAVKVLAGEVVDATFMSVRELKDFFEQEIQDAKDSEVLLSLHMKATMMKNSDPVIFGHCVTTFFKPAFEKHAALFQELGVQPKNGLQDVYDKIAPLPKEKRDEVAADLDACYADRPWLAMVNSDKGITNLHIPSDVIVDASMPVVVRDSGKMWNKDGRLEDTKCLIPDRCYATMYQEVISYCKANNQFDVATMGNVPNVGLMAKKAEEYGSHDKTFEIPADGTVTVTDSAGKVIFEHRVEAGDIWRMCQTKDEPIRDWVRLAVQRARLTGNPAIFWLDSHRAHDANLIEKVQTYLADHDTAGLDLTIARPTEAVRRTMERATEGLDTISVTGNVLRDYLTDLFPILELGTSAKMLSIVPLLAGGGLFETGAGGSAPKHVQQFVDEGHLRWDSLGEYLAIAVSLEHLGETFNNERAKKLATALNDAVGRLLQNRKSPSRKVNELDNRASTFYVGLYWAEFMAEVDPEFRDIAQQLCDNRGKIVEEMKGCQGSPQDIGGYYMPDPTLAANVMRPSPTLNAIIDGTL